MRSQSELLEAAGYQDHPHELNELLRILDGDLRLITPTDPEGHGSQSERESDKQYYQLTHDYLVPPLREWLTRKQRETRKGRAELKLAERAATWHAKPETRHLPSLLEWASIRTLTDNRKWSQSQQQVVRAAGRLHGIRAGLVSLAAALLIAGGVVLTRDINQRRDQAVAQSSVDGLLGAETAQIRDRIASIQPYRQWADPLLREAFAQSAEESTAKLHASLALLSTDATHVDFLKQRLLSAQPSQVPVIRELLLSHKAELLQELWQIVQQPEPEQEKSILHAAAALAGFAPDSEQWKDASITARVVNKLVSENPLRAAIWIDSLQPIRGTLFQSLAEVFKNRDEKFSDAQRDLATDILEQLAADDVASLSQLILEAEPKQFVALFDKFAAYGQQALALMHRELDRTVTFDWDDPALDPTWKAVAESVAIAFTNATGAIAENYAYCQTMPLEQFLEIAETLRSSGYRPTRVRPYAYQGKVSVSAVWTRDSHPWKLVSDLTADEIVQRDQQFRAEGLLAADVAGYVTMEGDSPNDRYAGVWGARASESEEAGIYVGKLAADQNAAFAAIEFDGMHSQHSLQAFRSADGSLRYSGVKVASDIEINGTGSWDLTPADFANREYLDKIAWDASVSAAANPESPQQLMQTALAAAEDLLAKDADDPTGRSARAQANYQLGNDERAAEDFDWLIVRSPENAQLYMFRAILRTRASKLGEAAQDLEKFREFNQSDSTLPYLETLLNLHAGRVDAAFDGLEVFIESHSAAPTALYDSACAYALAAGILRDRDIAKSKVCADRAVDLLLIATGQSAQPARSKFGRIDPAT